MLPGMKKIFIAVCLLSVLTGCSTFRKQEPLPGVSQVDLNRFMGTWYVIASVPGILDKDAYNAVGIYSRATKGIQVNYQFNSGSFDGKLKSYSRKVMVNDPGINADWDITYVWPFKSDYKVLYLEPDYSLVVIGHSNRKDAWIMARQKQIEDAQYSDLILMLQGLGFNVGNIRLVPQS